jgi:CDGSH-type Zn-finger protein
VNTRDELIYLLSRASELEHNLACVYLFAAYSLKSDATEGGLREEDAAAVRSWKRKLAAVAVEEMLHLAQVSNLLTAIGGAPHFRRANFPLRPNAFSFGIELSLQPFSTELADRLVCYEMPEPGILSPDRQRIYDAIHARVATSRPVVLEPRPGSCEPFDVDFATVGEFYHKIETGFRSIPEAQLFIGPRAAQAKGRHLDLGRVLIEVVDRTSACAAIEMIVEQGEAPTADHPDAHFSVFDSIRTDYADRMAEATRSGTEFHPVRPVLSNPMTRLYEDATGANVITAPLAHDVSELFNTTYETMLLMLLRFFAHAEEDEDELRLLARGTLRLMASVLRPLGEALTKLPAGDAFPGKTAGPGFGYNDVQLLPHHDSAWAFFLERLFALVQRTTALAQRPGAPPELEEADAALQAVTAHLAPLLKHPISAVSVLPRATNTDRGVTIACEPDGPYLVSGLETMTNSKGETLGTRPALALCRCGGSALKPYCDGTHARIGFSSKKDPERTPDRLDRYVGGDVTIFDNRGTCCHAGYCTDRLPKVFRAGGEPFVDPEGGSAGEIISSVRTCPSGALGYSAGGVQYTGEDRPPAVFVSKDGPYHVQGAIVLEHEERNEGASLEHYALCRCGHSKNKPFCDGSHWYVHFQDEEN